MRWRAGVPDVAKGGCCPRLIRILTSDSEFYSLTRQFNRFLKSASDRFVIDAVPSEPLASFPDRFVAQAHTTPYDIVYSSHVTYNRQQTLIPDVGDFVRRVREAVLQAWQRYPRQQRDHSFGVGLPSLRPRPSENPREPELDPHPSLAPTLRGDHNPVICIDGYHSFAAFPFSLKTAVAHCFYLSGFLKHAASGANCCFMTVPPSVTLQPQLTGWLADLSVLSPGTYSKGVTSLLGP